MLTARTPSSRTPPGVRELKLSVVPDGRRCDAGRTPPGVRELKQLDAMKAYYKTLVAPLPGCVN